MHKEFSSPPAKPSLFDRLLASKEPERCTAEFITAGQLIEQTCARSARSADWNGIENSGGRRCTESSVWVALWWNSAKHEA